MVSNLNLLESRRRILLTTPHLESPTPANPLTFKSNMSAKLKEGKVYFTPVQEGTGDPSPDNVRPILGWDGVTVTKCGKNIANLNESDMLSYSWTKAFPNPFKKAGRYTISCQNNIVANNGNTGAFVFLGNAVTDSSVYGMTSWYFGKSVMSASFNITAEALTKNYIVFRFNGYPTYAAISDAQIQIEEGSTPTAYEPYTETQITIPFPKTIYGGYVDLVNGEVVETHKLFEFAWKDYTANYALSSTITRRRFPVSGTTTPSASYEGNVSNICKWYRNYSNNSVHFYNESGNAYVFLPPETDDNTTIALALELATPIHHTIDPQVIRPLKGVNNIWSDANGNIEIKFWKH